jgi:hypothetical protein
MSYSPMALFGLSMMSEDGNLLKGIVETDKSKATFLPRWWWEMARWSLGWVSGTSLHLAYAQEWMLSLLCWHMHVY